MISRKFFYFSFICLFSPIVMSQEFVRFETRSNEEMCNFLENDVRQRLSQKMKLVEDFDNQNEVFKLVVDYHLEASEDWNDHSCRFFIIYRSSKFTVKEKRIRVKKKNRINAQVKLRRNPNVLIFAVKGLEVVYLEIEEIPLNSEN